MIVTQNQPDRLLFEEPDGECYLRFTREGENVVVCGFHEAELTRENQQSLAFWLGGYVSTATSDIITSLGDNPTNGEVA